MNDLVLIVTRNGVGEWDDIWGFNQDDCVKKYTSNGSICANNDVIALMIMNGFKRDGLLDHNGDYIKGVLASNSLHCVVHGTQQEIVNYFVLNPVSYSLGDNNDNPTSLGLLVKNLASKIKQNNMSKFTEELEALKSAIRGDELSKAMGSFLEALSPLSLMQDQRTIDGVRKSLDGLGDAVKSDYLCAILQIISELLGLAENIKHGHSGHVVEWALKNDSMLKFLARRYL